MQKLLQTKERILEVIRQRGPELPVRVASAIGNNNLFTAAFMSELVGEQKLKLSNMRVGNSPLYYIEGQEEQLQKYTEYLNNKEREAFRNLKQNNILQDEELEPAIRVALRNIKDFAVPLQIAHKGEPKIFWKLHTISNEQAKILIEQKLNPKVEPVKKELEKIEMKKEAQEELKPKKESLKAFEEVKTKKTASKEINSPFLTNIRKILAEKNFEILTELSVKKKELAAKIRTETHLGKQEFYLIAKDKKKITTDDLVNALQKAHGEKMPALIMSPGEIDKKAQDYYKEWCNLIKHEKVKI